MKRSIAIILAIAALSTACNRNRSNYIVKESYIHKYGVPVTKEDWVKQGEDGQLVQQDKNGVTVTQSYEHGVLQGDTTYSFPNSSTVARSEKYEAGKLIARAVNYESGIAKMEEKFEGDELIRVNTWYSDGTPNYIEHYSHGCMTTAEYRNPNNEIESKVQEGFGLRIKRSGEGELIAKETIQNGKLIESITFYSNGEPKTVTPYENDLVHGMRLTFQQGGVPATVEQWVHGIQEGTTVVYLNGEKYGEIPYIAGKKNGVAKYYKDGEELVEEVCFKEDEKHGPRRLFVDNEAKTEWYYEGQLVNRVTFERLDPSGIFR